MSTSRSYEDFEPSFEWKQEEGSTTLVVYVPGFKIGQLKVQIHKLENLLIVGGKRCLGSGRWSRFRKEFPIPEDFTDAPVRAKFVNETLYVILPKFFVESQAQDMPAVMAQEPESGEKTTTEPKPREDQDPMSQKDRTLSSGKPDGTTLKQSNGERGEPDMKTALTAAISQSQYKPNKAQEPESGKKTTVEPELREGQDDRLSQSDSPLSLGKAWDDTTLNQSNGKSRETGEPAADVMETAATIQEKEKDQVHKAQKSDSGKKTKMEPEPREDQDRMSQKESSLSSGKLKEQSNGKSKETTEPVESTKTSPTIQEDVKDKIHKLDDEKQLASDKDAETLPSSTKRKAVVEDETLHDGGNGMEPKVNELGMRVEKSMQLILYVGVAALILVGLAFYVSYKLIIKSMYTHRN